MTLPPPSRRPGTPYEDGRIRLEEYDVPGSDGEMHMRTVVRHPGAVVLLPMKDDGKIVLVRNYRLPLNRHLVELPAGCLEKGEEVLTAAHRELAEETGYRAGKLTWLMAFYPSPGLLDERMDVFVAQELTPGERHLDATERMEVVEWPLAQLVAAIDEGEIDDAKTIAATLRMLRHPDFPGEP
ncbi:MAG: NUDIX hydrolase [Polyangiales bacterium]